MGIWFYNSVALSLRLFCSLSSSPFLPAFLADKPVKFFCSHFVLQNLNPEESKKERKKEKQSVKGKAKLASSRCVKNTGLICHYFCSFCLVYKKMKLCFPCLNLLLICNVKNGVNYFLVASLLCFHKPKRVLARTSSSIMYLKLIQQTL